MFKRYGILLLVFVTTELFGRSTLDISEPLKFERLKPFSEISKGYIEPPNTEMFKELDFKKISPAAQYGMQDDGNYYLLRTPIVNSSASDRKVVFFQNKAWSYDVTLYLRNNSAGETQLVGAMSIGDMHFPGYALEFTVPPGEHNLYAVFHSKTIDYISPTLTSSVTDVYLFQSSDAMLSWFLRGGIIALIIYNFFLAISLKNLEYYFYVGYGIAALIGIDVMNTWMNYFLKDFLEAYIVSMELLQRVSFACSGLVLGFISLFTKEYLSLKKSTALGKTLLLLTAFAFIYSVFSFATLSSETISFHVALSRIVFLANGIIVAIGVQQVIKNNHDAYYLIAGFTAIVISTSIWLTFTEFFAYNNIIVNNFAATGMFIEMSLFSVGLANKIKRRERAYQRSLKHEVAARTKDLTREVAITKMLIELKKNEANVLKLNEYLKVTISQFSHILRDAPMVFLVCGRRRSVVNYYASINLKWSDEVFSTLYQALEQSNFSAKDIGHTQNMIFLQSHIFEPGMKLASKALYGRLFILDAELTEAEFNSAKAMVELLSSVLRDVIQTDFELQEARLEPGFTDVYTKRFFFEYSKGFQDFLRYNYKPFSIIYLDLTRFKYVNDTFGHDIGDEILVHTTEIVKQNIGHGDSVFRVGGDEFLVFCPGTTQEDASKIVSRLDRYLFDVNYHPQRDDSITVEYSVSIGSFHSDSLHKCELKDDALISNIKKEAESEMYRKKSIYYELKGLKRRV